MELKTLKDLNFLDNTEKGFFYRDSCVECMFNMFDLRQEAIKWIKWFEQDVRKYHEWRMSHNITVRFPPDIEDDEDTKKVIDEKEMERSVKLHSSNQYTAMWIKQFFNITEEDLK